MRAENTEGTFTIFLEGEVDAQNAPTVKNEIYACLEGRGDSAVVFDAKDLIYISSAGLRVLLAAQKEAGKKISVVGLRPEVLEIFKMAGFQMLMDIKGS
ncbi:MAG: STAS domain-containing protein [Selenomonadaceae bacterium]|nr:STAS domain-containing protein [Selenomonadaceae bacterium]